MRASYGGLGSPSPGLTAAWLPSGRFEGCLGAEAAIAETTPPKRQSAGPGPHCNNRENIALATAQARHEPGLDERQRPLPAEERAGLPQAVAVMNQLILRNAFVAASVVLLAFTPIRSA